MKMELNDETLTAYALGELDAAETKAVEKLLAEAARAGNDSPRKALDEIRNAIAVSEAAFAGPADGPVLSEDQRNKVITAAKSKHNPIGAVRWLAAAVALVMVGALAYTVLPRVVTQGETPGDKLALVDGKDEQAAVSRSAQMSKLPADTESQLQSLGYIAPGESTTHWSAPTDADVTLVQQEPVQPEPTSVAPPVTPEADLGFTLTNETAPEPTIADLNAPAQPEPKTDGVTATPIEDSIRVIREELGVPTIETPVADSAATQVAAATPERLAEVESKEVVAAARTTSPESGELRDNSVQASAAGQVIAGQDPTTIFKRRARIDGDTTAGARPAPKRSGGVAAASAPAAPPAASALPEISADTLFSAAEAPAGPAAPQMQPIAASATGEEREQLQALGYIDDSQKRAPVLGREVTALGNFQTARIEARDESWRYRQPTVTTPGSEAYAPIADAPFVRVADQPLSTFSIDVDTASYSNTRRFLQEGQLPPPNAVRVEELINYFDYAYPAPTDGRPFASHFEAVACPWAPEHTLVRIGLKGREVPRAERPASNLVFLIDVSGSMQPENKLPLVKRAMAMLTRQLDERDRVTIVTYANGVNLALPVTNAANQNTILGAIDALGAGGSTNGAGGIQLAYESARRNFLPGGTNRVILATDGDFNVGISDNDSLLALIQKEAKSDVFLSVFGFGMGNLKDDKLELLADKGNGVYGYIDSEAEARKVFVEKMSGTLVTIAKDVKIQVEFNPSRVGAYRLVGYENRALAAQDFNDDRKDAGEIGAGHTVTALYEIVPAGVAVPAGSVDALRYQSTGAAEAAPAAPALKTSPHNEELLLVKLRYKEPEGDVSKLLEFPLQDEKAETMSADLKFATAVAAFGKALRGNQLGTLNYDGMMQLAQAGLAANNDPHRAEMIHLMLTARPLLEGRWDVPTPVNGELSLVDMREVNGEWRVRIRTQSRTSWFQVGEAFEHYRVLGIMAGNGCVIVYNDRTQQNMTICLAGAQ